MLFSSKLSLLLVAAWALATAAAPVPVRLRRAIASAKDVSQPSAGTSDAFAADKSIDVQGIAAAAKKAGQDQIASYLARIGEDTKVPVYGDWLKDYGAFHFIADMDVDCDGVDYKCSNNPDGQRQTSFGHLSASQVPWYVIPQSLADKQKVKPNALGAVICDNRMYYAIFGDSNGNDPEVTGEGSLLLAQACFPDANINGNSGHDKIDVTYIVFQDTAPKNVGDQTIDIGELKQLGDKTLMKFQQSLGLSGGGSGSGNSTTDPSTSGNDPSSTPGGDPSSSGNDPSSSTPATDPSASGTPGGDPGAPGGADPTGTSTSDPATSSGGNDGENGSGNGNGNGSGGSGHHHHGSKTKSKSKDGDACPPPSSSR